VSTHLTTFEDPRRRPKSRQSNPHHSPHVSPGDEMLTLQEACAFLRIPEGTLRYWRHLGAGPRSFKIGRHVRYWKADLIDWLSEQTRRSTGSC
jgi:predicted DNA-binding transcriptional regulator AlpA